MKEDFISVVSFYDWMSNRDDSCPLNVPDFSTGQWCDGRPLKKRKQAVWFYRVPLTLICLCRLYAPLRQLIANISLTERKQSTGGKLR